MTKNKLVSTLKLMGAEDKLRLNDVKIYCFFEDHVDIRINLSGGIASISVYSSEKNKYYDAGYDTYDKMDYIDVVPYVLEHLSND